MNHSNKVVVYTVVCGFLVVTAVVLTGYFMTRTPLSENINAPVVSATQPIITVNKLSTQTPVSPTTNTLAWKTYRNDQYGFEIQYPPGWDITTTDGAILSLKYSDHPTSQFTNEGLIQIGVMDLKLYPPKAESEYVYNLAQKANFTVGGEKALRMVAYDSQNGHTDNFLFLHQHIYFNVPLIWTFVGKPDGVSEYGKKNDILTTGSNIISTLKFVYITSPAVTKTVSGSASNISTTP